MKHHLITSMIAVLFIVTVLTGVYYKLTRSPIINEPFDNREIPELYDTGMTDVTMKKPIRYVNVNDQQHIFWEIIQLFKKLTKPQSEQRTFSSDCDYELYKPETTPIEVTDELNEVTDKIMELVRENGQYAFVRNTYSTYDNIGRYEDTTGNVRYDYDVFVQDPINAFQLRLKIDVIKYIDPAQKRRRDRILQENTESTCAKVTRPAFPTYPIGYPKPRQEIPLPTQVIPTGRQLIGIKGVNIRDPLPIRSLYLNSIRIYNTNWVLGADKLCGLKEYGTDLGGFSDGTLDSSKCKLGTSNNGGCQEPAYLYNPWIPVPGEEKYPHYDKNCDIGSVFKWDKNGVMPTPNPPCAGVRDPRIQQPFTAEYNPTVATLPRWEGDNDWLFQLGRGQHWSQGGY